jgi:hypothetical protein
MGKYKTFGSRFDRVHRNDLNANFAAVEADINAQKNRVDELITGTPQPSEVVDSRGGFPVLRDRLDDLSSSLAQNTSFLDDITVFVRKFKTGSNTWNQALQDAVNYAVTLYGESTEIANVAIPRNVTVRMPKGRHVITSTITVPKGIDFDFTGCTFVASPSDKTLVFMDYTNRVFRCTFTKGAFAGFHTAFKLATGNIDTSNIVFESPTFQSCLYGIDTVSYLTSRSTFLQINNIYSIQTDCPIKTHTDMTHVEGGWIYHSGYNGAAIYNQGFTKLSNVVFVPTPAQSGARTRWIDNHSEDGGSTSILGQRGLTIDHCRFGGETGSCPIIFNYATADLVLTQYQSTIISIENSILSSVGTNDKANIILFNMPNRISIKNCTGFTDLANGIIHADTSFDASLVAYSRYISIEFDDSTTYSSSFPLIDATLYRFLKGYKSQQDLFQGTYQGSGLKGQVPAVATGTAGQAKTTIKLDQGTSVSKQLGASFLVVTTAGCTGGDSGYKAVTTSIVHCVGGFGSTNQKRLSFSKLYGTLGGNTFADSADIISVHWGTGDTGSVDQNKGVANNDVTIVFNSKGAIADAAISIIPLYGHNLV